MTAENQPHTMTKRLPGSPAAELTRRTALCRLVAGTIGLLETTPEIARAQATPTALEAAPNHFELTGAETEITYDTTIAGRPQLTYVGPYGHQVLLGEQLRDEERALGRMVTGSLGAFPDQGELWLTLLLPRFASMTSGDTPVPFTTIAILTWVISTIAGPPLTGALEEYRVVDLQGTAQVV
jgi:hypothetical protein